MELYFSECALLVFLKAKYPDTSIKSTLLFRPKQLQITKISVYHLYREETLLKPYKSLAAPFSLFTLEQWQQLRMS